MTNITNETKNSSYTYIYVSREYYDGKCLNENRLGIGKTKDPHKRLKDHNSSSSKISVEVKFEIIYKTKEDDKFFHSLLKKKGFKQIKKEIFEGTENRPLTLTEIKNIIEPYAIEGPWIYNKHNQFIKVKTNTQNTYTQLNQDEQTWIKTAINKRQTKISKTKSLDEQWEDDLHQFHLESWLIGLPAQFIFQICMFNNKRFEHDKIGFIVLDFGMIILHALIQTYIYHSFKNKWIQKHYK